MTDCFKKLFPFNYGESKCNSEKNKCCIGMKCYDTKTCNDSNECNKDAKKCPITSKLLYIIFFIPKLFLTFIHILFRIMDFIIRLFGWFVVSLLILTILMLYPNDNSINIYNAKDGKHKLLDQSFSYHYFMNGLKQSSSKSNCKHEINEKYKDRAKKIKVKTDKLTCYDKNNQPYFESNNVFEFVEKDNNIGNNENNTKVIKKSKKK